MYLVDTNVWLERLLSQERSEEVGEFLARTPSDQLFITDFAYHSIGVILTRLKKPEVFVTFSKDTLIDGAVSLVHLEPSDAPDLISIVKGGMDFDDAYQYAAAEKHNLIIVSFDSDFDRMPSGRKTPGDIVKGQVHQSFDETP